MRCYRSAEAMERFQTFIDIEHSGWKGVKGSSIKALLATNRFFLDFNEILYQTGTLILFMLELNGEAIAGAWGFLDGKILHILKTGYREEFSHFSPSSLLFIMTIEYLYEAFPEVEICHMFPGDYGYKHRFSNAQAYTQETILFPSSPRGFLVQALYRIYRLKSSLTS